MPFLSFLERAFLVLSQADSIRFVGHIVESRKRKGIRAARTMSFRLVSHGSSIDCSVGVRCCFTTVSRVHRYRFQSRLFLVRASIPLPVNVCS